ncbi:HAD family hydrolase [Bacillus sp. 1P06AnD]|uniref:HAD family hydrolase n=1 Tax=Bacillus sp. 1P06AnD TaxID=3132208 RepID=UPI00399F8DF3
MKAVIFDFDGTLANTLPLCFYAFQHVFKKYDQADYAPKDIVAMFGPSETGIIELNLMHPDKAGAIDLYYELYESEHDQYVQPIQMIEKMLQNLKDKGYKLGIYTGKARKSLDISLKALNIGDYFDAAVTGDDVSCPKPDPEGLLNVLKILNVPANETIYVGDSEGDIMAGKAAGMGTVGVQWMPTYQSAVFPVKPDHMADSFQSFLDWMD